MSKRKNRAPCFLDIKDLLKFDPSLHYFSTCPACKELVSEHADAGFLRQQLAQLNEGDGEGEDDHDASYASASSNPKKKQKGPIPVAEAAALVQKGKLCCTIGCTRRPVYNLKGLKPRFCRHHKEDNMVNSREKICQHEGCETPATHKEVGKKPCKKLCDEHKAEGMVRIGDSCRVCAAEGCPRTPSFNLPGEKPRFCTHHKEEGMVNLNRRTCQHEGCDKTASYNFRGLKVALFCSAHKDMGMINIKTPVCGRDGCPMKPYFNFRTEKSGKYCSSHQEAGMVNLHVIQTRRVCHKAGCDRCACFGFSKADPLRFCAAHKERGMVDVQNIACAFLGCEKRPNFNFWGVKKGHVCATHKEEGMVNVVSERRKERSEEQAVLHVV